MTPENFVYWLQGYFEICEVGENGERFNPEITGDQVKVIRDHLALVLEKKTPDIKRPFSFIQHPPYAPVIPSGLGTDPVYYYHNSRSPPASC